MIETTRRIGLSLGADICWPLCYEGILRKFDPRIRIGDEILNFMVERVSIEPFDLKQPVKYDVVMDRLTHWYHPSREWIKKAILLNDLYVFNNPWSVQSMEKQTSYCAMMRLGMPIPDTWMIPPKAYEPTADLQPTLKQYARLFDVGQCGEALGYPLFMKPYDGGGWVGVTKCDNDRELRVAYEESGKLLMHLQAAVLPHDLFVRGIGVGPQVRIVKYDPGAPLHRRYTEERDFLSAEQVSLVEDTVLTINTFFGWDFNSCEMLRQDGTFYPIDFANACPDSQVTSLHLHFPWLVLAKLKWSLFCAATKRKMRKTLDWEPYLEVAAEERPFREKLAAYAAIARERLEADRFAEFCEEHLSGLHEVALDFFGSAPAKEAVRLKTAALFPAHEVEEFTEHFWSKIQAWRETGGAA